ncbi:MAG: hypothetical protein MJA83_12690 [Gammaproteobacteria bacterium]|nr:hypothetical protein [Gammaproteobacteria bacterium]
MIVREWRGLTKLEDKEVYLEYVRKTGVADYQATAGHVATYVFIGEKEGFAEFVVQTLWESEDAIRSFAGEDIAIARYYPDDDDYLIDKPKYVRHYNLVESRLHSTPIGD